MSSLWFGKCCGAVILKLLSPIHWISFFLVLMPLQIAKASGVDFGVLMVEFKKGNYTFVASESKKLIEQEKFEPKDERLILLYISSSASLKEMDALMESSYQTNQKRGSIFYNAIYLLMERGLVVGDHTLVEKWGYRFRLNGRSSSRYAEGLYLYASMFYDSNRPKDSLFIISLAQQESPPDILQAKLGRLKDFIVLEQKKGSP